MLRPPLPERERICVYGHAGSGKTKFGYDLMETLAEAGFDGKVYVLDTWGEWDFGFPFITQLPCENYAEAEYITQKAVTDLGPNDWFVADKWDVWNWSQENYMGRKGETRSEYLTRVTVEHIERGVVPGGKGFDQFREVNWSAVNSICSEVTVPIINKCKANLLLVCEQKPFDPKETDRGVVDTYSEHKAMPAAQKRLCYQVRTLLWLKKQQGQHVMTTVKEGIRRVNRPYVKNMPWENSVGDYFMGIAKWELDL